MNKDLTDKEKTDIIRKIADKEWECHRLDRERTRLNTKRNKLLRENPIEENKLLRELLNRLEYLKEQRRKVLKDIKYEKLNEFRRKRDLRKQIPELQENSKEVKEINEKMSIAFEELNDLGARYGSELYNAGWELFKLERDKTGVKDKNPQEVAE